MELALLSDSFQSLPLLPTIKLGSSGAASRVGGFLYVLGPCGSLQWILLWGWESLLLPPQTRQVFSIRGLRLYFPTLELWVARLVTRSTSCCLTSQLQLCPPCSTIQHFAGSTSCCLARVLSAPLPISAPPTNLDECFFFISLVVGLPYSSIFCQVWLFFVFKLFLSFVWLCGESQCAYPCLHLGWKSVWVFFELSWWQAGKQDLKCSGERQFCSFLYTFGIRTYLMIIQNLICAEIIFFWISKFKTWSQMR